jgi:hypothetical protein
MLLVTVVAALAMSMLVGPAPHACAHPGCPATVSASATSAQAQPAPLDRGSANVRHAPAGQPLAETARAFGSSTLGGDATEGSDQPLFLSLAWTARSPRALRQVLESVAPRLGRAPPSSRVS